MKLCKRLMQRRAAAMRVEEIRERIRELREAMTRITPRYDANGGGGSGGDRMMAYTARLDQLERDLTRASRRAYRISVETLEDMDDLTRDQYSVIVLRDFLGMSWSETARRMDCSIANCRKMRDMALGYRKKKKL